MINIANTVHQYIQCCPLVQVPALKRRCTRTNFPLRSKFAGERGVRWQKATPAWIVSNLPPVGSAASFFLWIACAPKIAVPPLEQSSICKMALVISSGFWCGISREPLRYAWTSWRSFVCDYQPRLRVYFHWVCFWHFSHQFLTWQCTRTTSPPVISGVSLLFIPAHFSP